VSCAGVGWAARTLDKTGKPHDLKLFETVVGINLIGTFNVLRLAASAISKAAPLEHNERGVIVNTASVAAYDGQIGQIAYAASKAGVVGMTLPAARDLAPAGIRVVTIAPGIFDTPMLGGLPEDKRAALAADVVFPKRLGDPAEYGAMVAIVETATSAARRSARRPPACRRVMPTASAAARSGSRLASPGPSPRRPEYVKNRPARAWSSCVPDRRRSLDELVRARAAP
jgi:NAD(P)-dependent dehydrogenase (short-subunit alcohol dehydrogenase family)